MNKKKVDRRIKKWNKKWIKFSKKMRGDMKEPSKKWNKFGRKICRSMKKVEKKYCKNDIRNIIALYNRKE